MQLFDIYKYPLDLRGTLNDNLISAEAYDIDVEVTPVIVVREGTYYATSLKVMDASTGNLLTLGKEYNYYAFDGEASEETAKECYACIKFTKGMSLPDKVLIEYRLVGGKYINRIYPLMEAVIAISSDNRKTYWEDILGKPLTFTPVAHLHYLSEVEDWKALIHAIRDNTDANVYMFDAVQSRLEKLISNLDESNTEEHQSIIAMIKNIGNDGADYEKRLKNIESILSDKTGAKLGFVPITRKVNGKSLNSDVSLTYNDVDAVSATKGGTFASGFIDAVTNVGRIASAPTITITSKTNIDNMVAGSMVPVSKISTNYDILPMNLGTGMLIKYPTPNSSSKLGYVVVLYSHDGNMWHGYASSETIITWYGYKRDNTIDMAPGMIMMYGGLVAPTGFMLLAGGKFSKSENPVLANMFTNGYVPDARGCTVRGLDNGRGYDTWGTRAMGSYQGDFIRNITGNFNTRTHRGEVDSINGVFAYNGVSVNDDGWDGWVNSVRGVIFDASTVVPTGEENTMKNIALNYIIKMG